MSLPCQWILAGFYAQLQFVSSHLGPICIGFSSDKGNEESYDFQFAKWMMKEKVSLLSASAAFLSDGGNPHFDMTGNCLHSTDSFLFS